MDIIRRSKVLILFLVFLFSTQNYFILSLGTMNIICKPSERTALLSFKQHLNDSFNSLSSWSGENCCGWVGVHCHNTTHHVIHLHLHKLGLGGELNSSLLALKQLRHLDLSGNAFDGIRIPDFLGSLQSLRYLNLSGACFSGMIPPQLGKLSNLHYLDLSFNYDCSSSQNTLTVVSNFQWISYLSSLKHLDLTWVNLKNASNWFRVVNMFPSLLVLRLCGCFLSSGSLPSSLSHVNFTSLVVLDLSNNIFNSPLPEWLYSLTNLEKLDLSLNSFQGTISPSIGNLTKLTILNLSSNKFTGDVSGILESLALSIDLSDNQLSGPIPLSIGRMSLLKELYLSNNKLNGSLPESLGNLSKLDTLHITKNAILQHLQHLHLRSNSFQGTISPSIGNLTKLTHLELSSNQLEGELPITLGNLCKLQALHLGVNQLSGRLPDELGRLSLLEELQLSTNKLNGSLPESLGNLSKLDTLDITKNAFEGVVSEVHFANLTNLQSLSMDSLVLKVSPEWIPPFQLFEATLGSCQLGPEFPIWLRTQKSLKQLDLSRTGISGTIPTWFWNFSTNHFSFDLSNNSLYGELPKLINATVIYLNSNQFSGQLPRVISNVRELDLSNNSFSGSISAFLCNPPENNYLYTLDLSHNLLSGNLSDCWVYWAHLYRLSLAGNNLSGELPSSLRNCTSLSSIDFGKNGLTGRLPIWLGESLSGLEYLRLRSNKFYGEIPLELCHLASIHVLDIAHNDLRGSIPRCFNNFSFITTKEHDYVYGTNSFGKFVDKTQLMVKGREVDYYKMPRALVTSLDLSKNSLSGEIPEELTSLLGLMHLNLSWNGFTGRIPEKIGNMSLLESLDFSNNNISGAIPQSISGISTLSYLDLSYNNLSGKIPLGTQLQSFNESSFIGNQELCGPPLKINCSREDPPQKPGDRADEDEDWFEMKWFYISMGVGFVVGFWAFCGVMVLKSSWRIAYFRFYFLSYRSYSFFIMLIRYFFVTFYRFIVVGLDAN